MSVDRLQVHEARLEPYNLGMVVALLRRCFPAAHHIDESFLAWQYLESPEGRSRCFHAFADGRLVGHAAFSPMRARFDGELASGSLVHNVATDPDYRDGGIFTSLLAAGIEAARASDDRFVLAVPNDRSVRAFVARHDFQALGALEARLGFGATPVPSSVEAGGFSRTWTTEALRWRLARPGARYGYVLRDEALRLECETGTLGVRGELAWLPRDLLGGEDLREVPLLSRPRLTPTLCIGLDTRREWGLRPYVNLPVRARPAPLHLVFRDLAETAPGLSREHVRFRLLDFDAY